MFTKQDYEDYFQVLEDREKDMLANISAAILKVDDDHVASLFTEIREEEKAHVRAVMSLRKAVDEFYASQDTGPSDGAPQ